MSHQHSHVWCLLTLTAGLIFISLLGFLPFAYLISLNCIQILFVDNVIETYWWIWIVLSWCFWHFRITKWQMAFRRWQSRTTVSPLRVSNQHVVVRWSVSSYCWEGLCTHTVLLLVWCSTMCCQRIVPHSCMSSLCCHVARRCRIASVSLVFVVFAVIRSVSKEQMTIHVRNSVVVML